MEFTPKSETTGVEEAPATSGLGILQSGGDSTHMDGGPLQMPGSAYTGNPSALQPCPDVVIDLADKGTWHAESL